MSDEYINNCSGKKSGFVILNENLFAVDKYSIHDVQVQQTILAGERVSLNSNKP